MKKIDTSLDGSDVAAVQRSSRKKTGLNLLLIQNIIGINNAHIHSRTTT